jgi:hypothetical protein
MGKEDGDGAWGEGGRSMERRMKELKKNTSVVVT